MRILVTGASGLLGLNLALEAAGDHQIIGQVNRHLLRYSGSYPPGTAKRTKLGQRFGEQQEKAAHQSGSEQVGEQAYGLSFIQTDLLLPGAIERLLEQAQPDWVINCAALAIVDQCESDPELARQLNIELPAQLAAQCRRVTRGGARFLHISTDAVFDGQRGNYTEEDEPNPLGVYARSKLESEQRVMQANPEALVARVNLFGWSLSGKRSLGEFFFYNLQAGNPLKGFTDVFFCPLQANDLGRLLVRMLEKGLTGLYHAVSSESLSKYDFGVRLARRFGLDEKLIAPVSLAEGGLKAARSPNLTLRTDKLSLALGSPPPDIATGMERFYRQYREGYPQMIKELEIRE